MFFPHCPPTSQISASHYFANKAIQCVHPSKKKINPSDIIWLQAVRTKNKVKGKLFDISSPLVQTCKCKKTLMINDHKGGKIPEKSLLFVFKNYGNAKLIHLKYSKSQHIWCTHHFNNTLNITLALFWSLIQSPFLFFLFPVSSSLSCTC